MRLCVTLMESSLCDAKRFLEWFASDNIDVTQGHWTSQICLESSIHGRLLPWSPEKEHAKILSRWSCCRLWLWVPPPQKQKHARRCMNTCI